MTSDQVILTRKGYEKMLEELKVLKTTKRIEAANALEKARAHGDLRENSEYDAAKHNKQQLETRIAMLEERLSRAKVVDASEGATDKAYLGTTVDVKNLDSGDTFRYMLVSQDEADINTGKVSVTSPIGKGILGKAVGEKTEIDIPAGKIKLEILKIVRE